MPNSEGAVDEREPLRGVHHRVSVEPNHARTPCLIGSDEGAGEEEKNHGIETGGTASMVGTIANIVKNVIGSGVLNVPRSLATAGYPAALGVLTVMGILNGFTLYMLVSPVYSQACSHAALN
eukprot:725211-Rhodomonas_salina.1